MVNPWLKALRLFLASLGGASFLLAAWAASEHGNQPLSLACLAAATSSLAYLVRVGQDKE